MPSLNNKGEAKLPLVHYAISLESRHAEPSTYEQAVTKENSISNTLNQTPCMCVNLFLQARISAYAGTGTLFPSITAVYMGCITYTFNNIIIVVGTDGYLTLSNSKMIAVTKTKEL